MMRTSLAATLLAIAMAASVNAQSQPSAGDEDAALYNYNPRPLSRIAPAVDLPSGLADAGWNHLILIARPKVVAGDVDQIPPAAQRYSDLFLTVIAASTDTQVRPEGTRYVLKDVGITLATRIGDRDATVSRATLQEQGAQIGLLGPMALAAAEQRLDDVKLVARSPTMAVVDSPAVIVHDDRNVAAVLRHAVMVDPRNGRVDTIVWEIELNDQGAYRAIRGPLRVLPANLDFENQLRVDITKFRLTMPEPTAFGMVRMPPGETVEPNAELAELAALPRLTPSALYHLEVRLWETLYSVSPVASKD